MNGINERFEARRNRQEHPTGTFDKAGRWYPSMDEARSCCTKVRPPSRSYPYSLMVHCRTRKHIDHLAVEEPNARYLAEVD